MCEFTKMYTCRYKATSEIVVEVVVPHWMALSVLSHHPSWQVLLQYLHVGIAHYMNVIICSKQCSCRIQPQQVYSRLEWCPACASSSHQCAESILRKEEGKMV